MRPRRKNASSGLIADALPESIMRYLYVSECLRFFLQDDAIVVAVIAVQYLKTGSGTTRKPESG
jgi:hypothetical protein